MKRVLILLLLSVLVKSCLSQVVSTNIEIRKASPQLKLNGTSASIDFYNSDITLTQSANTLSLAGGDFSMGANNLYLTGAIGTTSNRSSKGWFTNMEISNVPTINGVAMSSIYSPIANPIFTGLIKVNTDTVPTMAWVRTQGVGGGGTWGSIIGTLSNQTDLANALDAKSNTVSPVFTVSATLPTSTSIGNISSTEISYIDNARSNLQAQLDDTTEYKAAFRSSFNAQTGTSYTLGLTDEFKIVTMTNSSANTVTIPPNVTAAFPIGSQITIVQMGAGETSIVPGSGVTLYSADNDRDLRVIYSSCTLLKTAINTWLLIGDIEP